MAKGSKPTSEFPSKDAIRAFIRDSTSPVTRREVARAFHIHGDDRVRLKSVLRELEAEGTVTRGQKRRLAGRGALPGVAVVRIERVDGDGTLYGHALVDDAAEGLQITVVPDRRKPALAPGDRVLARLERRAPTRYEAHVMRRLETAPARALGIVEKTPTGLRIRPTDRRQTRDFVVDEPPGFTVTPGDLVEIETLPGSRLGPARARITERLGDTDSPGALSLIAIHAAELPVAFSDAALSEARAAAPVSLGKRTDLRKIPLVTIDGADARDFDDAVWAEAAPEGGWHLVVAIADVAHYVRPESALDREALARGNSAYFPDRVVPMLPEALSNDLCSLRPAVDRACLAAHLWIDDEGRLKRHTFVRGLMRSAARLTYEQVQAAVDGDPDAVTAPLLDIVIRPLMGAFAALDHAQIGRQALALDLTERQIELSPDGTIAAIRPRARLDSHRLIELFMIAANVAAAEALEGRRAPCLYRIHDQPDQARVDALREVLESTGLKLPRAQVPKPAQFNRVLEKVKGTKNEQLVNTMVLRCQAQAVYSPENIGHFGLALDRYAHFTSPIRRYADLVVHRALITACGLGDGGLPADRDPRLDAVGEQVSMTERRAAAAERSAFDRFAALHLSEQVGALLEGTISGATRAGLFVELALTGTSGLAPMRNLPADYYVVDEATQSLVGRDSGRRYRIGDAVGVRLAATDPFTGTVELEVLEEGASTSGARRKSRGVGPPRRGRPGRRAPR